MSGTGMFGLPMELWTEAVRWTGQQMQRQGRFLELAFRVPDKPTWNTPNRVVLDLVPLRLRQFVVEDPDFVYHTDQYCDIPVIVVTPQVNHSTICDYAPEQSLVTTLLQQGYSRVYATEWKSATQERAHETLDDSFQAIKDCIDEIGEPVRLLGLCQGGWMSMVHTALHPDQVESLILAAAPIDFHTEPSGVNLMARTYPMLFYHSLVALGAGVLKGEFISMGFDNLRPMERHFGKYMSLFAHVDDHDFVERYKRLTDWYGVPQHLPGRSYLQIVKELFKKNSLIKGTFQIQGRTVDLAQVDCPLYMLAGSRDHITRQGQLFAAENYVSSSVIRKYTTDAGHIGVFMSRQALKKDWPLLLQEMHQDSLR